MFKNMYKKLLDSIMKAAQPAQANQCSNDQFHKKSQPKDFNRITFKAST